MRVLPGRAFLCVLGLTLCFASAQTPRSSKKTKPAPAAAPGDAWPIETLKVQGNNVYSAEQVLTIAGLKVGQVVKPADFEAARLRLLATGAFQSAGYKFDRAAGGQAYRGTFEVVEETQMYPILFEDLPASDRKMRAYLHEQDPLFGSKIPATQPVVHRYEQLLDDYLKPLGFKDKVVGRLTSELTPELVILFRPSSPRPVVAEVTFKNTGEIPVAVLQNAIASAAVGMGYTEGRMRQWLESSARPLYEAKGRLRVSFPTIETSPAKNSKGLAVTIHVDQGEVYKLASVKAEGAEDLARYIKALKLGEIANFDAIAKSQTQIVEALKRRGYLHAASTLSRTLDDTKHTVAVVIQAQPGTQYTMGNLTITGLDLISEPAIRKLWGLGPGKPFNIEYPDYFLKVVRDQNLFENLGKTRAETAVHEDTRIVDVSLFFEGGRPKPRKDREPE